MEDLNVNFVVQEVELNRIKFIEVIENNNFTAIKDDDGIRLYNRNNERIPNYTPFGENLFYLAKRIFDEQKRDSF
ncbi:hypothetical protein [Sphingobacterium sp.]|uniref:hypothetical protein n=1 Tax=Sphingobacterium sp. TaxID=341027 RepID=UPI0028A8DCD2|nr:hypothetical protein [Sphingobacterium sp.]